MEWKAMAASGLAALALTACQHAAPAPSRERLYTETPFAIDKAGRRATLEFEATPADVDRSKTYMVRLAFDRTQGHEPDWQISGRPPRTLLPFKVRVIHIHEGRQEKLPLFDASEFLGKVDIENYPNAVPADPDKDVYYSFLYALDGPQAYVCIARFNLRQYGKYRAEVETVQDQSLFDGVKSTLSIQERFNLGE